jgi:hypothetical protein
LGQIVEALARLSLVGIYGKWMDTKTAKMEARERKR